MLYCYWLRLNCCVIIFFEVIHIRITKNNNTSQFIYLDISYRPTNVLVTRIFIAEFRFVGSLFWGFYLLSADGFVKKRLLPEEKMSANTQVTRAKTFKAFNVGQERIGRKITIQLEIIRRIPNHIRPSNNWRLLL